MARPEPTDIRARHSLLSGDHSPLWGRGHYKLESFGFLGRKFCIKNVEILSFGKIAEFAKFAGGKRRKSPDRFPFISWPKAGISLMGGFLTLYRSGAGAERK